MSAGHVADDTIQEILRRSETLSNAPFAVGIAILPFRLIGVITDLGGINRGVHQWDLPRMDVTHVVQGIAGLAGYLVRTSLGIALPNPRIRIGLQIGGPVDTATGEVIFYRNPVDEPARGRQQEEPWVNVDLAGKVQEATGCPTVVDNDAHALAAYELKLGVDAQSFVLIFINDGVGAGVVLNQKLLSAPIEFGHLRSFEEGRDCECKGTGCIDAHAGRRAIRTAVSELTKLDGIDDIERAVQIADRGDAVAAKALRAFERAGKSIACGAATMLTLFGPSHLVIYGPEILVGSDPSSAAQRCFLGELEKFREYAYPAMRNCQLVLRPIPPYTSPDLGAHGAADRGAHGAALIALHRHFFAPLGSRLEHSI